MPAAADDWRRMGQERDLPSGTPLTLERYRAYSGTWEHDHCLFCFAKFMDADFSEEHRRLVEEHPEVLTEGYTTTAEYEHGANYHWVCAECFGDFAEEFEWQLVET